MKKMINTCHIEGLLYEHKLELRESGPKSKNPGTQFIMGTVDIATDDKLTNVVSVHYTYVTEKTTKGATNATFTTLKNIIDGKFGSVMADGADKAVKLRIDSALALNEFYTERDGVETLVSAKRNEGGFIHLADSLNEDENARSTFKCDMLITGVKEVEANEELELPAKVVVKGAVFDFKNSLLPVEFSAVNPGAMNYFLSLDASNSNPTFTCVWGRQVSETVVRKIVEESAFGEDSVREVKNTRKDFVITGASKEPYTFDDEGFLTNAEVVEAVAARETYLATIKQRNEEFKAAKAAAATPGVTPSNSGFNF